MALEDFTVRQFEKALINGDRSLMTEEQFAENYEEWVDITQSYNTEEFSKSVYINKLVSRLNSIRISLSTQKEFAKEFGIPYLQALGFFDRFGYKLKWNESLDDFESQLNRIEASEFKYESQLEGKIKELELYREKKKSVQDTSNKKSSREKWVSTINTLNKIGYQIRKDETTAEELAYMIKYQLEESKSR